MGWSLGGSAMLRDRPLDGGGDTRDLSLQWSFNPWYYHGAIPLTYLGEVGYGTLQRPFSGNSTDQVAQYHQVSWAVARGVNVHVHYEFWDPDREVIDDHIHRPSLAFDVTPVNHLMLRVDVRQGIPAGSDAQASQDVFMQLHGWF